MSTNTTKQEALRTAIALKHKMKHPSKWVVYVWNNLGWCYSIQCGSITLCESSNEGQYYALMSAGEPGWGLPAWTDNFTSKDPNEVVEHQIELAKKFIAQCQSAVDSVTL